MKISLEVSNLNVQYANLIALKDINLSLEGGNICALIGINGSGKSTLFKAIIGVLKSKGAEVKICSLSLKNAIKNCLITYIPQNEEIDFDFPISVWELVMMGRYGHMGFFKCSKEIDKKIVTKALNQVDMLEFNHRQISKLSGGQRKRIFIARALASEAKIILLDDPFNGVDVKSENMILELLLELKTKGYLIIISTHDIDMAIEYCNQTILLKNMVFGFDDTNNILTKKNLNEIFGGNLRYFALNTSDKLQNGIKENSGNINRAF